jgi:hypothetical protein
VFDGNITVMIVAIILMILGSGAMLSFAYSLLTGVLLNFLAGVTASQLMMRSLSQHKKFASESFIRAFLGGSRYEILQLLSAPKVVLPDLRHRDRDRHRRHGHQWSPA